jgi:hypothetical protein
MRTPLLLLAAAALVPAATAQTVLISESFESAQGSPTIGYSFSDPEFDIRNNRFFKRTDGSNIQDQGNGLYSGQDGSRYVAGRNQDAGADNTYITTFDAVDASGLVDLNLSFLAATMRQGVFDNGVNVTDYLYLQYSLDGGSTFQPCVMFEADANLNGDLRIDTNNDGVGDGALLSLVDFTEYSCTIAAGSANTVVRVVSNNDTFPEGAAFDLVRLAGEAAPADITGSITGGTCGPVPFNRPSETTRCFPNITGTNNTGEEQRFTLFFVIEGTGAISSYSRVAKRGEVKLNDGESATNKFSLRTKDTDPDGTYELVLLAELGSVPAPTGSAIELDRVTFTKGGGLLRSAEDLSVFPNPATDVATLRFAVDAETAATVTVYDALGRQVLVAHEGVAAGVVEAEVNAAALPAGLYVARLVTDSRTETLRFSVVR